MRFRERESPGSSQEWGKSGLRLKSHFFSELAIAAGLGSNGASHPGTLIYIGSNLPLPSKLSAQGIPMGSSLPLPSKLSARGIPMSSNLPQPSQLSALGISMGSNLTQPSQLTALGIPMGSNLPQTLQVAAADTTCAAHPKATRTSSQAG
jgi:hypothetical protein